MTYISLALIWIYIIYAIIDKGVPHSLSATYYDYGITFSAVITLCASLIFPDIMLITPTLFEFLPFIMICGIFFVAFAPNFKWNNLTDKVHTGAAIISLIASLIWVGLLNPLTFIWWIPLLFYIVIGRKINMPCIKFWAEVIMLLTIYQLII